MAVVGLFGISLITRASSLIFYETAQLVISHTTSKASRITPRYV